MSAENEIATYAVKQAGANFRFLLKSLGLYVIFEGGVYRTDNPKIIQALDAKLHPDSPMFSANIAHHIHKLDRRGAEQLSLAYQARAATGQGTSVMFSDAARQVLADRDTQLRAAGIEDSVREEFRLGISASTLNGIPDAAQPPVADNLTGAELTVVATPRVDVVRNTDLKTDPNGRVLENTSGTLYGKAGVVSAAVDDPTLPAAIKMAGIKINAAAGQASK